MIRFRFGYPRILTLLAVVLASGSGLEAALSVTLTGAAAAPPVTGTVITWTANPAGASAGPLWYRFRTRALDEDFRTVRDFGPSNVLKWAASEHEGLYEIEVTVRDLGSGEVAQISRIQTIGSRVIGDGLIISQLDNPLVFLYSAPGCPEGNRMKVQFQADGDRSATSTPFKDCRSDMSMNFYLAGMRTNSIYHVWNTVDTGGGLVDSPTQDLAVPDISLSIAPYSVLQPPKKATTQGILLQSTFTQATVATDLAGNLVWYYPEPVTTMTRPVAGGYVWAVIEAPGQDASIQAVREFDLAGNTVAETNAARVSEQLLAMGKRQISAFHHEAATLPDGKILVLGSTEQILNDVQGDGPVDVLGDMILVLDSQLQVVWAWDAFDYLDPSRAAVLGEICSATIAGCPPFYQSDQANDWLHGNSVQLAPDGNLIYSVRHQDLVLKIDYANGQGSGDILWRLGQGGDFSLASNDPSQWFSHQHDAGYDATGQYFLLFDNGNTRNAADPLANSRGQVFQLDEQNMVAKLVLNVDLGVFSMALGSAHKLDNGDYHFNIGWQPDFTSASVELDSAGNINYSVEIETPQYRTFRMQDLYTP